VNALLPGARAVLSKLENADAASELLAVTTQLTEMPTAARWRALEE